MKKLPVLLSVLGLMTACSDNHSTDSAVQSIATNLSDKDGKLARTFLYLLEGDTVRQRECQVAAPQGVQDCRTLKSSKKLNAFRSELDADMALSRNRVNQSLTSLKRDRDTVNQRRANLTTQIQSLQNQINQGGGTPSGENVAQLQAALNFAQSEREKIRKQLQQARDPAQIAQLQGFLAAFDQQIADLKARIAAAQGGGNTAELKKQLADAQAALAQANTDLNGLNTKIQAAESQKAVIDEEFRILNATLEKLKQPLVLDARDVSFNASQAEKQLSSRFHKLFQANGPDCSAPSVNAMKELAIGEAAVYTSREAQVGGSWHIGEIVKQLLGGNPSPAQVEAFFRNWVQNWQVETRFASGDTVTARPDFALVLNEWKQASEARGIEGLDLRIAPFRLIGITNRLDLRNPLLTGDAGEARLVFALLEQSTDRPQDGGVNARPFTLIFEYKISVGSDSDISRWAGLWHELGSQTCTAASCDAYASRLAQITRMFTHRNQGGFVQARLNQARTNEIAFGNPWELREFNLQPAQGAANARLVMVDVKKTPKLSANNSVELNRFVSSLSLDNIIRNNYDIPANLKGAKAHVAGNGPQWTVGGDVQKANAFNINTCNGCHSSDQNVIDGFYHISPFQPLGQAAMSNHLKNDDMPRRVTNFGSFLVDPSCQAGTPFDARLAQDAPRMLSRPVH
jgi:predicted  nucleic acid-binding Zn-ribbon protein